MKNQKNKKREKRKFPIMQIAVLFVVMIAASFSCGFSINTDKGQAEQSDVIVLDSPDEMLMGGWIFKNPDNPYELLAFEFGPDSTFVVMNFLNGEQVGETLSGKCVYLNIKGYKAIEMKLDNSTETMYYYYSVVGDIATFTDNETGEVMPMQLVKKVKLAE